MNPKYFTFGKDFAVATASVASASWDQMPEPYEGRAVYKLIGTFERVTQPAAPLPFEVGKVYKDCVDNEWRVLATDRNSSNFPVVAMRIRCGVLNIFSVTGKDGSGNMSDLIPNQSPATTRVEFVPVKESES